MATNSISFSSKIRDEPGKSQLVMTKPHPNFVNLAHLYPKIKRMRNGMKQEEKQSLPTTNNIENVIEHINIEPGAKLVYNGRPIGHQRNRSLQSNADKFTMTKNKFTEM